MRIKQSMIQFQSTIVIRLAEEHTHCDVLLLFKHNTIVSCQSPIEQVPFAQKLRNALMILNLYYYRISVIRKNPRIAIETILLRQSYQ